MYFFQQQFFLLLIQPHDQLQVGRAAQRHEAGALAVERQRGELNLRPAVEEEEGLIGGSRNSFGSRLSSTAALDLVRCMKILCIIIRRLRFA